MSRAGSIVAAIALGSVVAVSAPAHASVPVDGSAGGCGSWTSSVVTTGAGMLENLEFDGNGSMVLSQSALIGPGALLKVAPDGTRTTLVGDVTGPGGLVARDGSVYFTTGNSTVSGLFGIADGSLRKVDVAEGSVTTIADGLVMPNGLVPLDGNRFLTARTLTRPGLTVINSDGTSSIVREDLGTVDGLARSGSTIYVTTTFDMVTAVHVLDAHDLGGAVRTITLPGFGPANMADDLTVGPDGALYVAFNAGGKVVRVDPDSGSSCEIASGLPFTSAVKFGAGPGWDPNSLYTTGFLGEVHRLERVAG
ncbi:SMP-30/gluconolactonase/LRE family protein [Rhodococcus erythropolis]|uniref:SMP-30/gluconolactonase/LRE family protein n=1 Tax=Rhodococcus erythropolis TaxID=1833 RepID=UPI001E514B98|nr:MULTISPECIES: SMP-30/gluconolactonase/LRE family protein [Rhodococcus erythropolis group]MCD2104150.1 SMP-30/gluconolactonase/LRE family protein [Rhodococcus qingshengii]MCZ4523203.1 SMP-30/gluconolactonase/LRE family protein [Rhodococcus erythropolis]